MPSWERSPKASHATATAASAAIATPIATRIATLATGQIPAEGDAATRQPQLCPSPGVRVLGGTYAIDGDSVRFSWMDAVPGATPEIDDVLVTVEA